VDYLKNRDYYAAKGKRWREANPDRPRELWTAWYAEHRDELLAKLAAPEERARMQAWQNADRAANPEKYRERTKRERQDNEAYTLRNREASRRRQTGTTYSRILYTAVLERDGMVCHLCGGAIPSLADLHFDHVIPLAKGGEHTLENVRPSHALCNLRKSDRLI
jgi:5-methylcytosine-specific restriction endonuclease McrA